MKFTATNDKGEDIMPELQAFAAAIGLEAVAKHRYSLAFLLELFGGSKSDMQNPAKIIHEIRALEGLSPPTRTKPAIPFKYPPLKGLMHKHHLQDGVSAFAKNVQNELKAKGLPNLKQRIDEVQRSGAVRYFTQEGTAVADRVFD
jgi:hypothetical protein